jgi:hypothetical protein
MVEPRIDPVARHLDDHQLGTFVERVFALA